MPALRVIRPGLLTTVQDLGRWGLQDRGVPVGGPMDGYAHRTANRLVGNPETAAALEVTLIGPEIEPDGEVVCAVAGGVFPVTVDRQRMAVGAPFRVPAGARLRIGERLAGARAALAIAGGIDVPPVFGSRATSLSAGIGGLRGRALQTGDVVPIGFAGGVPASSPAPSTIVPGTGATLRVMIGPHAARFDADALRGLLTGRFTITPESNRMGYRLSGPAVPTVAGGELLSDATPMGSLQVLPSGQIVLLMADRQTTGGYPRIATVVTADLPIAAQLAPGDALGFAACTRDVALEALRRQRAALERIA